MPLLQWFTRRKPAAESAPPSLTEHDADSPASRKSERTARRELLYTVVRECMIKASLLSSQYRFKVLSLDKRGRRSLLMIDLDGPMPGGHAQLAQVERSITETAKVRHGLLVKAVYWRQLGSAPMPILTTRHAPAPEPASPAVETPAAATPAPPRSTHDPIDANEVAAFRKALAAGVARPVPRDPEGAIEKAPRNYTLLTGFEDTEMHDGRRSDLSTTQPGDLR